MEFLNSYYDAFHSCMKEKKFSIAHMNKMSKNMYIDSLGCYKVFISLSGQKTFHIDGQSHECLPGDVFFISPQEWHYFSDFAYEDEHERIVCFIYPLFLKACSSENTDLGACFSRASSHHNHKLSLSPIQQEQLMNYIKRLHCKPAFGQDILDRSIFLELLVYLNQMFIVHFSKTQEIVLPTNSNPPQVNELIYYINHHLSEDLSTATLASHFFLSPSYLCRTFRNATGTTLHKYVTAKRVTLAKNHLADGMSVSETCSACGFNDYSNFIKIFTKSVGVSPKKYAMLQRDS